MKSLFFILIALAQIAFAADGRVKEFREELLKNPAQELAANPSELGFNAPPTATGITYGNAFTDAEGNAYVVLSGTGKGFNLKLKNGPVIVSHRMEWEGNHRPDIVDVVPKVNGPGVIGLTASGDLYDITPPRRGERTLKPVLIALGDFKKIVQKDGQIYALNDSESSVFPVEYVRGQNIVRQLSEEQLPHRRKAPRARNIPPEDAPVGRERLQVSKRDYKEAVRIAVSQVPELRRAWALPGGHNIFFGGGGLRGLLKWLDREIAADNFLRKQDPGRASFLDQLRSRKVFTPSIKLLVQEGADFDLWIENKMAETQLWANGYHEWDVLDKEFYDASVRAGGAALEKLKVNPADIQDPLGALDDYYDGRISFKLVSEREFEATRNRLQHGNSQTALALRFLRFAMENPQLRISDESHRALKELSERERNFPVSNYWIHKGLAKLLRSAGPDVPSMFKLLDDSGLMKNLVRNGYSLESIRAYDKNYLKLSPEDYRSVFEMAGDLSKREMFATFLTGDDWAVMNPQESMLKLIGYYSVEQFGEYLPSFDNLDRLFEFLKLNPEYVRMKHRPSLGVFNNYFLPHLDKLARMDRGNPETDEVMKSIVGENKWLSAKEKVQQDKKVPCRAFRKVAGE